MKSSTAVQAVDQFIHVDGVRYEISRAWPHRADIAFEARAAETGQLRAGFLRGGQVRLLEPGVDEKLPALARLSSVGAVISHRPGRRAVLRHDDGDKFIKVVRPGRSSSMIAGVERATAFAGSFTTPSILTSSADTVTFSAVPGVAVLETAKTVSRSTWRKLWIEFADRWVAAVGTETDPAIDMPIHSSSDEAAVIREWIGRAERVIGVEAAANLLESASGVLAELEARPSGSLVPAHRDLHDKQLLWDADSGLALIDVDTACLAEPGLDLANLRAHATLREQQQLYTAEQAEVVRDTVDLIATELGVDSSTLRLYESGTLLRLRCVYAFRPRWANLAAKLT